MKEIPALLEKNLEIMSKFQPKLARRLRQELDSMDEMPYGDIQETVSGRWVKVGESAPFFDKEPVLPARYKLEGQSYCFIIQGIGYPPYLFHILRGITKDALSIVVLEPNIQLFLQTLSMTSVYQAVPQAARISFVAYQERNLIDEAIWFNVTPIGIFPILEAMSINHQGLLESDAEKRDAIYREFWEQLRFRAEQLGNSAEDTLLGVRHGALNTPWIVRGPSISDIREFIGKRPAVCVASGPSLKKNVDQLKGMEEKCLIVACDSSLISLLRRGIRPHVVVTIERNLMYDVWVPGVLSEFYEECSNILLVSQSVSEPQTVGRWPGPTFIVGKMDSPADTWLVHEVLGRNLLASGMSVSHMAMNFALAMESPAVAMIGQDLAFAEDGETTHIEDASSATPDGIARERAFPKREIPGALGGIVKTHQMWFYFLQIFERFLDVVEKGRVFQCTEGGAAINGAETIPLSSFFKKNVETESLLPPLSGLHKLCEMNSTFVENEETLHLRLESAAEKLHYCEELLKEMETEVDFTTAPALLPERRRAHAVKVAELLDRLHASHRALAFIGQSYTHRAGSSLMKNRFLDTVARVEEWKRDHLEIIKAHQVNVMFLKQWLEYMKIVCETSVSTHFDVFSQFNEKELLAEIEKRLLLFFNEKEPNLLGDNGVILTYLLCRVDFLRQESVSPENIWNVARFMKLQGRPFEARNLMGRAYSLLEGREMPSESVVLFLHDWARMEASHDLIRTPRFDFAILLLRNILEYDSSMSETVKREIEILLQEQRKMMDEAHLFMKGTNQFLVWDYMKRAQESLEKQDIPEVFSYLLKMLDFLHLYPDTILPYVYWLLKTALDCRGALDDRINEACEEALNMIFEKKEILSSYGFFWSEKWVEYLQERGVSINFYATKRVAEEKACQQ